VVRQTNDRDAKTDCNYILRHTYIINSVAGTYHVAAKVIQALKGGVNCNDLGVVMKLDTVLGSTSSLQLIHWPQPEKNFDFGWVIIIIDGVFFLSFRHGSVVGETLNACFSCKSDLWLL
jgi:hypothetical protein